MTDDTILSVRNLKKHYPITQGILSKEVGRVRAVDGISFDMARGETLGLVGESGCGKSTAATSIIRLEEPTSGEVIFNSREADSVTSVPEEGEHPNDVTNFDKKELKTFRRRAQMIFQDPSSSLDPRMAIGESIAEPLRVHGLSDREARRNIVRNLLDRVGLSGDDYHRFPHEFSGGQKQRINLARALVMNPELIIADEPVSALDVSIQAEILSLIKDIQDEFNLSILFISHDMGVIREVSDRVAVMYLGKIAEIGPTEELFNTPQHPYTEALLSSIPTPDPRTAGMGIQLTGDVPSPSDPPRGCRFHTRCHRIIQPESYDLDQEHWRGVMDLRVRLEREGIDTEALEKFAGIEASMEEADKADVTEADLERELRAEFDIPDELSDPAADEILQEAITMIVTDRFDEAQELLASQFPTICQDEEPELVNTEAGHPASCHLHAEDQEFEWGTGSTSEQAADD